MRGGFAPRPRIEGHHGDVSPLSQNDQPIPRAERHGRGRLPDWGADRRRAHRADSRLPAPARRRSAVLLILPDDAPDWADDRARLWNAAELAETRKNSTVAREFEIALPAELDAGQRQRLAVDFARELVERHGCVADVAIHQPGRDGDQRNHHAHILLTTRRLTAAGFGAKTRELDDLKTGEIGRWRERFAEVQNACLREAGVEVRVDHRSLEAQEIDREATIHLGPTATALERRGVPTRLGESNREVQAGSTSEHRRSERERPQRAAEREASGEPKPQVASGGGSPRPAPDRSESRSSPCVLKPPDCIRPQVFPLPAGSGALKH